MPALLAGSVPVAVVLRVNVFPEEPTADDDERGRDERVNSEFGVEREEHHAHGQTSICSRKPPVICCSRLWITSLSYATRLITEPTWWRS